MASIANALQYQYGLTLQAAEGSIPGSADILVPAFSGGFKPVQSIQPFEVSDQNAARPGYYKKSASWSGELQVPAFPAITGLVFFALLGADTLSGTVDPYTHKLQPTAANVSAQWLTGWQKRPDPSTPLWERFEDGTVESVQVDFAAGEPVKLTPRLVGKTITAGTTPIQTNSITQKFSATGAAAPTGTGVTAGAYAYPAAGAVVETDWYSQIGATFKYVLSGMTVATSTFIESGRMTISRATEMIQTTSLTPSHRSQGLFDIAFSLTALYPGNYNDYRQTFYGTTNGTALSSTVNVGSIDFIFPSQQAGGRQLEFQVPDAGASGGSFILEATPHDMDARAGALRVDFAGHFMVPVSGALLSVIGVGDTSTAF